MVDGFGHSAEEANNAPVAQLDRVPGYELGGREFESLRARHTPRRCFGTFLFDPETSLKAKFGAVWKRVLPGTWLDPIDDCDDHP